MKKLLGLLLLCTVGGCNQQKDTRKSVIDDTIEWLSSGAFTEEEAARWDSMNAEGGYLLIRGSERNLDTIVNHTHVIFITEE